MPYKIERLKPVYLFIILSIFFSLGLFSQKTLIQSVFSKKEIKEEIMVGDVNDTMDYSFEVNWNDTDYSSNRPSSVTYNLYNVLDENTVVSTTTLTSANVDSEDSNKWNGVFNNVRKYNDDESEAKYIIKQQEINGYVQNYDVSNMNGLCVEFGNNVFGGDTTKSIKIIGTKSYMRYESWGSYMVWDNYYLLNPRTGDNNFYYEDLNNNTKCVSIYDDTEVYFEGNNVNLDINSIYSAEVDTELDDVYDWFNSYLNNFDYYDKNNYPTHIGEKVAKYHWDNNNNNSIISGANVITNIYNKKNLKFDKYWEDEGYENYRPNSSEYYLYKKENQNDALKTITLTSNNADPNDSYHWIGVFENIDTYNQDGTMIEYVVREKNIPKYTTSYDSNNGYYIKFNENSETGNVTAFNIFYYNEANDHWYYYTPLQSGGGLGNFVSGNTIRIDLNDLEKMNDNYGGNPFAYWGNEDIYNRIDTSIYHQIKEYVGTDYPETYHPVAVYDYFDYSYTYSLSNHSKKLYFSYNGASWGGEYGIKVDNISTVGDETIITSRINLNNFKITKKWDDEGHESSRPTSTTVDIYDSRNRNDIVKTITISNEDKITDNIWEKVIDDLPKYDENLQPIEYVIVERPVDGYKTIYDFDEYYNNLAVTFGSNISLYDTYLGYMTPENVEESKYTVAYCSGRYYCYTNDQYGTNNGYDLITNRTVYIPGRNFLVAPSSNRTNQRFNIVDVVPYHIDGYDEPYNKQINTIWGAISSSTTYDNYPKLDYDLPENTYSYFVYTWNGSLVPRANANVIINKYNKTDYSFVKKWDDVGFENGRPENIKFNIYNALDMNTVVKQVSLTNSNENPNNHNEWNGYVSDLPKYNDDMTYAQYVAVEEVINEYKTDSRIMYNSLCIKFGSNVFNGDDNNAIQFFVRKDGRYSMLQNTAYDYMTPSFNRNDLMNKTICLPVEEGHYDFYIVGRTSNLDIQEITRGYETNYVYFPTMVNRVDPAIEFKNDNMPNITDDSYIHYVWDYDEYFYGSTIITNHANMREEGYVKEFNDTGYEYNRPKEIVFGLYVDNDPIPKEMATVHTSTCINNKCNIEFKYVRDKDNEGNPITYQIKEISDYGYDVTYEDDKVINTANPVEIKLIKENTEGKVLSGAKLGIYNKDGDKIKEITSTDKEITIKLLPSTYTIKEEEAPKDYSRCQDITLVVNKDGTYTQDGNTVDRVKIVNEYAKDRYDITIKKELIGEDSKKEFTFEINIEGVEDPLEYIGSKTGTIELVNNKATIRISSGDSITIKNVPADSKYEVKELETNYTLTIVGESKGTLNRNEIIEFINKVEEESVPDEKESPTPITGVYNITTYIVGALLLLLSIFLIAYSKKQINKKEI